jgi:hypothetical protein
MSRRVRMRAVDPAAFRRSKEAAHGRGDRRGSLRKPDRPAKNRPRVTGAMTKHQSHPEKGREKT